LTHSLNGGALDRFRKGKMVFVHLPREPVSIEQLLETDDSRTLFNGNGRKGCRLFDISILFFTARDLNAR